MSNVASVLPTGMPLLIREGGAGGGIIASRSIQLVLAQCGQGLLRATDAAFSSECVGRCERSSQQATMVGNRS